MAGVNKVILLGNLGNDPDMRYMPNGEPVANISIATSANWTDKNTGEKREKTEWHRVVAYRRTAEVIGQYCQKGDKIYIEGRLQTRKWDDQEGKTHYTTEVIADSIQLLGGRGQGSGQNQQPQSQGRGYGNNVPANRQSRQYGGGNQGGQYQQSSHQQGAQTPPQQQYQPPPSDDNGYPPDSFDDDIPF